MTNQGQSRRFDDDFRCPVCGGCDTDPRGQDQRCFGYATADWVYCTREEHANGAPFDDKKKAYYHKARGNCKCGVEHAPDNEPARKPRRGRLVVVAEYPYLDAANNENFKVLRFVDESTGEKTFRQTHWDRQLGKYARGRGPAPLILYKLDMLAKAPAEAVVWIVEGEKDVNRLNKLGLLATCNPMGAGKWKDFFSNSLADRTCVILPDNDQTGKDHAKDVARSLQKTAKSVKILDLPGLPEKGDVSDWLNAGKDNTVARLRELASVAPELIGVDLGPPPAKEKPAAKQAVAKPTIAASAELLMKIAEDVHLWRTPTKEPYFSIPYEEGRKHVPALSQELERWLRSRLWRLHKMHVPTESLAACASILAMQAEESGEEFKTWVRVADATPPGTDNFLFFLDLFDKQRHAVRVTAEGWEVVVDPPGVKFLRPNGMSPLPMPERGGSLDELWEFCNVAEDERMLLIGTLTAMMRPFGPYPLMVLNGEQGSAKSTTARVLKRLVDPRKPILGSLPDTPLDLWVVASSNWLLSFDNISSINRTMSNALCQLALEGGLERRKLHTDMDVVIMEAMRPMILNGIDDFARQPDLVDRVVLLTCPVIDERARRLERAFWARFYELQPRLLGALLDVIAGGLKHLPSIHLESMPRMAELATWGEAVGRHLGWREGAFVGALFKNRDESSLMAIEDSPVAHALFALGRKAPEWRGSVKELLDDLRDTLNPGDHPGSAWPRTPRGLSSHLRRIAPALRRSGVKVAFSGKTERGRVIEVSWREASEPGTPSKTGNQPSGPSADGEPPAPGWKQNQNGEWVAF